MHDLLELKTWERIVQTSDVKMSVAAGENFGKWQRIDMKKLETWNVACLPLCKELLQSFAKRASEASHV